MADPNTNPTPTEADKSGKARELTKAAAAKMVRRRHVKVADGVENVTFAALKEDEVLDFRDYGTHVVVVTVDGQKFSSADTPAKG